MEQVLQALLERLHGLLPWMQVLPESALGDFETRPARSLEHHVPGRCRLRVVLLPDQIVLDGWWRVGWRAAHDVPEIWHARVEYADPGFLQQVVCGCERQRDRLVQHGLLRRGDVGTGAGGE